LGEPGDNLARVLRLWGELAQSEAMEPLADALAEDVVWQGLAPELVCHGRDQVREVLGWPRNGRVPRVTRMTAEEVGDWVVVTVEGPDFGPGPAGAVLEASGGPRTLALLFEGGRVARMESFADREDALRAKT